MLTLWRALRLDGTPSVALVGAGGKTTAALTIAREGKPSIITTTTHLAADEPAHAGVHLVWPAGAEELSGPLCDDAPVVAVTGPFDRASGRWSGLDRGSFDALRAAARRLGRFLIVEADGSKRRPLKAPGPHEPAIPEGVDRVVVVAGLNGVDMPLTSDHVHRPECFSDLSGLASNARIDGEHLVRVLVHPDGGLKGIREATVPSVLLTHAEGERETLAATMAPALLRAFAGVTAACLAHGVGRHEATGGHCLVARAAHERAAGVILAAGRSARFGRPKPLLDFEGRPFVRAVAETALAAQLSPVVVVVGANAEQVASAVVDLPVTVVRNPEWMVGQSRSVRAGVAALPARTGSALFLLADQPQVTPAVIEALIECHAQGLYRVVAPEVAGRRATPVLFDTDTFGDLLHLTGDQGGRPVIERYGYQGVPWLDDGLLLDVDTPEDYERLRNLHGAIG